MFRNRFHIPPSGEENLTGFGISMTEAWQALHAARQLTLPLGESVIIVMACTHSGRPVYLFLEEDPNEDDVWNVLAGRDMTEAEFTRFTDRTRSQS